CEVGCQATPVIIVRIAITRGHDHLWVLLANDVNHRAHHPAVRKCLRREADNPSACVGLTPPLALLVAQPELATARCPVHPLPRGGATNSPRPLRAHNRLATRQCETATRRRVEIMHIPARGVARQDTTVRELQRVTLHKRRVEKLVRGVPHANEPLVEHATDRVPDRGGNTLAGARPLVADTRGPGGERLLGLPNHALKVGEHGENLAGRDRLESSGRALVGFPHHIRQGTPGAVRERLELGEPARESAARRIPDALHVIAATLPLGGGVVGDALPRGGCDVLEVRPFHLEVRLGCAPGVEEWGEGVSAEVRHDCAERCANIPTDFLGCGLASRLTSGCVAGELRECAGVDLRQLAVVILGGAGVDNPLTGVNAGDRVTVLVEAGEPIDLVGAGAYEGETVPSVATATSVAGETTTGSMALLAPAGLLAGEREANVYRRLSQGGQRALNALYDLIERPSIGVNRDSLAPNRIEPVVCGFRLGH